MKTLQIADGKLGFDHHGTWIVNPNYDESMLGKVNPEEYYGIPRDIADAMEVLHLAKEDGKIRLV